VAQGADGNKAAVSGQLVSERNPATTLAALVLAPALLVCW
jgi:hypothetical protein